MLSKSRPVSKEGGGGVALAPLTFRLPPNPHHRGSLFLLISDLKQSEVEILFYSNLLIV